MPKSLQTYLLETTNSHFARRLQQKFVRRTIVICGVTWLIIMAFLFSRVDDYLWFLAIVELHFLILASMLVLSIYGIFELPETILDEYQLKIRNQAYKRAYSFTLVFLLITIVIVFGLNMSKVHAFATALTSFLATALAPRAIAAWTLESFNSDDEYV